MNMIHPDPDRGLLFKGLFFNGISYHSKLAPDFIWPSSGIATAYCAITGGHKHLSSIGNCACGIYSTYDVEYAIRYRKKGLAGALFLLQPGGETVYYENGARSEMAQLIAVVEMDYQSLSVIRASNFFSIPILRVDTAAAVVDIHMMQLSKKLGLGYRPKYYSEEKIRGFIESMQVGG